jgi:hypothetical protein
MEKTTPSRKRKEPEGEDDDGTQPLPDSPLGKRPRSSNINETLPFELVSAILTFATEPWLDGTDDPSPIATVCRFVCRLWRDLLPSPDHRNILPVAFCASVAHRGHLNLLRWARGLEEPCPANEATINAAAEQGHVEIVRWALASGIRASSDAYFYAAGCGSVETLAVLLKHGVPFEGSPQEKRVYKRAAKRGHLAAIDWLAENGAPDDGGIASAAAGGHIHVLEWALLRSFELNGVYSHAAAKGRLDVMEWASSKNIGTTSSWDACARAASGGHLAALAWMCERMFPWFPERVAVAAALSGRIDVLEWLREREGDVSSSVVCAASAGGHEGVLRWFVGAFGGIAPKRFKQAALLAVTAERMSCLAYLRTVGSLERTQCFNLAVEDDKISVVEWFIAEGIAPRPAANDSVVFTALLNRCFDVARLLIAHGYPVDPVQYSRIMSTARCGGNWERRRTTHKRVYSADYAGAMKDLRRKAPHWATPFLFAHSFGCLCTGCKK